MKIGILGAGLTGLTIGALMSDTHLDYHVIEKEKSSGGLMRSTIKDGFTFDVGGSHIIFSKDRKALEFMTSTLGNNVVRKRRKTKILYNGRYLKYPFENGLSGLPQRENFDCLIGFVDNLISKERVNSAAPRNLKEWCYHTFGKGIAEKYLIPYNEKIWKMPAESMGLDWVDRIPNPPVEDIVKSSLGIRTEGYVHQLHFYYPENGGIQSITNALEKRIGAEQISKGIRIEKISREDGLWIVSSKKKELAFHKLVSTVPLHEFVCLVKDLPSSIKKSVGRLRYNSLITVGIGLDTRDTRRLTWLYNPDKDFLAHRISYPCNLSGRTVPRGKSSVLAEITCMENDAFWKKSRSVIVNRVLDDLHRSKILNRKDVITTVVTKSKYAYVLNDLNFKQRRDEIRNHILNLGIDLVGRFSEFAYLNMDLCVRHSLDYCGRIRRSLK